MPQLLRNNRAQALSIMRIGGLDNVTALPEVSPGISSDAIAHRGFRDMIRLAPDNQTHRAIGLRRHADMYDNDQHHAAALEWLIRPRCRAKSGTLSLRPKRTVPNPVRRSGRNSNFPGVREP
jgi:hypothetical protein